MNYLIKGLDPIEFTHLFDRRDDDLAREGILAVYAEDNNYPCRISLDGAAEGDRMLLVNYLHQPAASPYRSSHAIYVAQGSQTRGVFRNTIPPVMQSRLLSVRAFDSNDMIIDADVIDGTSAEILVKKFLDEERTAYLHVHFAKRGCFAATVGRE